MERVVGIGGIFIKAKDPTALREWYREHLGIRFEDWGGAVFESDPNNKAGTVWSLFEESSDYFSPSTARFMINYRVKDLNSVLAALRNEGCEVDHNVSDSEQGRFGWVMDPEGNRVELWEPPQS